MVAGIVVVGLIGTAGAAVATPAQRVPTALASVHEVMSAKVPAMSTAARQSVANAYQHVASAPNLRLPAENRDPLTERTVLPMAGKWLVADFRSGVDRLSVYNYVVDRGTGAAKLVDKIDAHRAGGQDRATVTFPATGHTATMSRNDAAASCQSCDLASLALGVLNIASKCGIVEEIPFVGEICDGIVLVVSIGGGHICQAQNCKPSVPTDGFYAHMRNCNFNTCSFDTAVQNGVGTQLLSLGSDIVWDYPGFSSATLDSGGTASEVDDFVNVILNPVANEGGAQIYAWNHVSSEPNWATCSATIEWSVSARWSDNVLYTTGFQGPLGKPFMANCKNYKANA
ncbi:MAG: hypothetical protein QOD07_885 [Frankiaceae bacterium]|nr:hypothetical protein [Frankiaceae bacterium]